MLREKGSAGSYLRNDKGAVSAPNHVLGYVQDDDILTNLANNDDIATYAGTRLLSAEDRINFLQELIRDPAR